ncbi:hypothetical protein H9W90_15035 [Polaribacter pectinis]|uniref:Outer membrane protein beta-barrel domain-containing protein n=1 Tax=Polaribacter pectinis TaxID=2738844 RepID=A0A7G9LA32_9FLAO|nr:hypothetical protein [Polaribacter pectinis]QNM85481.1 hypothetical protein H9W90_15035 [Polaribacter pectinis]
MKKIISFLFLIIISINSFSQNNRDLLIRNGNTVNNNSNKNKDFKTEKFNLGFNFGALFSTYGKEFDKTFDNTLGLNVGLDFFYKKIFIGFNMLFSSSKLKQDLIIDNFYLNTGKRSMINNGNIALGYTVYETNRFRLLPFIGYGGFGFVEVSNDNSDESAFINNVAFGLNFDLKSNKRTSNKPNFIGYYERSSFYLRAKIFVSNSIGKSSFKGNSINMGLNIGIEGSMFKNH